MGAHLALRGKVRLRTAETCVAYVARGTLARLSRARARQDGATPAGVPPDQKPENLHSGPAGTFEQKATVSGLLIITPRSPRCARATISCIKSPRNIRSSAAPAGVDGETT